MSLYGLIGQTLTHSFSKKYFSEKFAAEGIAASYELFELPEISDLHLLLGSGQRLRGLNVTIPYKQEVISFLDQLSVAAKEVGAVNTIAFREDGLVGYNTDIIGFQRSLLENWEGEIPDSALILGTGGASKAVRYVLQHLGIPDDAIWLASRAPVEPQQIAYSNLRDLDWNKMKWVINTTPLGTYPDIERKPDIPYEKLGEEHLAFDLVYNPAETAFMAACALCGAKTVNGYDMLVYQAEASWEIWNS